MITITDKANCTGCTACKSVCSKGAIVMKPDNEGFMYPKVDVNLCVECGLCEKVCPIINYNKYEGNKVIAGYAAHYKTDDKVWYESASGGAFTSITDYVMLHNGIVYGARYNDKWEVLHDSADTKEGLLQFRDSKYVQSNLTDCFLRVKDDLKSGRLVLFSGTPCQIAGLKSFLRKDYDNLLTVDLICHCVPSPRVFKDYIQYIEQKYKRKIVKFHTKDKTLGWNKFQTPRIYFDGGSNIFNIPDSRLWETIFYSHLTVRPSCHTCKFSNLHRTGDITIGDFWGVEKQHPEYLTPQGTSIMLINTPKAEQMFVEISKNLQYVKTDVEKALPSTLVYSTTPHPKRNRFWSDYEVLSFNKLINKYFGFGLKNKIKNEVKNILYIPIKVIKKVR